MSGNGVQYDPVDARTQALDIHGAWWMAWYSNQDVVLVLGGTCAGIVCGSASRGEFLSSAGDAGHGESLARGVLCAECPVMLVGSGDVGVPRAIAGYDHPAAAIRHAAAGEFGVTKHAQCRGCGREYNYVYVKDDDRLQRDDEEYHHEIEVVDHGFYFGQLDKSDTLCGHHTCARSSAQADIEVNPGPVEDDRGGEGSSMSMIIARLTELSTARRSAGVEERVADETVRSDDTGTERRDSLTMIAFGAGGVEEESQSVPWSDNALAHKIFAWIYGVQHQTDVQRAIVLAGIPMEVATIEMQRFVSNAARKTYYLSVLNPPVSSAGPSDNAYGNAFKASYYGGFRVGYLTWLCSQLPVASSVTTSLTPLVTDLTRDMTSSGRMYCSVCQHDVRSDGHAGRCVPRESESGATRRCAWTGDALHALDVRRLLLKCDLPERRLQLVAESVVSARAQREYMRLVGEDSDATVSDRVISTKFEAGYAAVYRCGYLAYLRRRLNSSLFADIEESVVTSMQNEVFVE